VGEGHDIGHHRHRRERVEVVEGDLVADVEQVVRVHGVADVEDVHGSDDVVGKLDVPVVHVLFGDRVLVVRLVGTVEVVVGKVQKRLVDAVVYLVVVDVDLDDGLT